ncbi:unnamed protein product [Pleuronectes platessa]|uniref:Uncharacterized protein n=1 Tax=Pleuronectes platessa TaxID=8262 RepID=A0A9N7TQJ6_PLEPL|nr:unnamed protein product [Pleuronectes platessa]
MLEFRNARTHAAVYSCIDHTSGQFILPISIKSNKDLRPATGAAGELVAQRPLHFHSNIYFLLGQFSGSPFHIIPATFRPIYPVFHPGRRDLPLGKGAVLSWRRPEEPSPIGLREEAEDFRATDSGILAMRFDASIH